MKGPTGCGHHISDQNKKRLNGGRTLRAISCVQLKNTVKALLLKANYDIDKSIYDCVSGCVGAEASPIGREVLEQIVKNYDMAKDAKMAICQDTGMAVVFVDWGQQVMLADGQLHDAINDAVREAYLEGYLRQSVVSDPLFDRVNTKDNTPAIVHLDMVPGDRVELLVGAKGFGSENTSALKMLVPGDGVGGVLDFIVETAKRAGPGACPPMVIGVGIGGTAEKAMTLAKKATMRPIDRRHPDNRYSELEQKALEAINRLGVGPAGLGGTTTALAVNIEYFPTHIAGLPVAVNICCHASRHAHATI